MFKAKLHRLITLLRRLLTRLTTSLRRAMGSLTTFWRRYNHTILLILLVATATILVTAGIATWLSQHHNLRFPSLGTIHTIGVQAYADPSLQQEINQIQWGTIYPGTANNVTLYLQSTSNIQVTLINETANWTFLDAANTTARGPSNTTAYMTLTWTYNGTLLNPNQTIPVTLTLHAHNTADFVRFLVNNHVTQFHFDIIIRANPE
jgi:hypothetical protein